MNKLPKNFHLHRYGLDVRLADISDSYFILLLRTNDSRSKYIHSTESNLKKQQEWMIAYKEREKEGKEFYFVFSIDGKDIGVYRLYNIVGDSFVCGSWIFSPLSPAGAGILGCIIGRELAYEDLQLNQCFTDVNEKNVSSIQFQRSFNPRVIKIEDGLIYFEHFKEQFYKIKPRFIKICMSLLKK